MKKQARLVPEKVFDNPSDRVLDRLEHSGNTTIQQDVNTTSHQAKDVVRKFTFQIRDSVMNRLKYAHLALAEQLSNDTPDREVIVEEAIVRVLAQLESEVKEELVSALTLRQQDRETGLSTGELVKPDSKKKKS